MKKKTHEPKYKMIAAEYSILKKVRSMDVDGIIVSC